MDDAAAGGHPLDLAGVDASTVAEAVAVLDRSCQDIGNCFDAPVRVPWKSRQVIFRIVVTEIVQQQERVEVRCIAETECAPQMHAGSFNGRFGFD